MSADRPVAYLTPALGERDHVRGLAEAPTTLVEYGDFECPYCGATARAVRNLQAEMGDRLRVAFRHFPTPEIHPHAELAAQAAEAAGAQGRFWEMHDLLLDNQTALEERDLVRYAERIGLDLERFRHDLHTGVHTARVREDRVSGEASGVNGTPKFYVNGARQDVLGLHALREAIAAASPPPDPPQEH